MNEFPANSVPRPTTCVCHNSFPLRDWLSVVILPLTRNATRRGWRDEDPWPSGPLSPSAGDDKGAEDEEAEDEDDDAEDDNDKDDDDDAAPEDDKEVEEEDE